jgi:hypothetical protein
MGNLIQIKRGAKASLPSLAVGELGFCTDTFETYVGSASGNKKIGAETFLPLAGGTLTGALTLSGAPTQDLHAATKAYVDAARTGLNVKAACRLATAAALATHTRTDNVLTASANGALSVDGVSPVLNDRILVKTEGSGTHLENGIYFLSQLGDGSNPWKLTRAADADESAEVTAGAFVFVAEGTANADMGFVLTTNDPITLNTTALTFTQFSGAGQITAGAGLTKTGNTLDVVSSGNGIVVNADSIALTYGSAVNTVCQGNDSRLSDARTPVSHTHGNITNAGYIGTTATLPIITGTGGILQAGSFGSAAGTFCQGNDSRLSDARTPLSHTHGNITNAGYIGTTATLPIITGTGGILQAGSFGSAAGTFCQGNDSRLHTQHTDTGTTSATFQLLSGSSGAKLKGSAAELQARNAADNAYLPFQASALDVFAATYKARLTFAGSTADRSFALPDNAGTALLSDASTVDGGTW